MCQMDSIPLDHGNGICAWVVLVAHNYGSAGDSLQIGSRDTSSL